MASKKCVSCFISLIATILFFWYLLDSIINIAMYNLWIRAIILTILVNIAIICCPVFRGYKCIGKFFSKEK